MCLSCGSSSCRVSILLLLIYEYSVSDVLNVEAVETNPEFFERTQMRHILQLLHKVRSNIERPNFLLHTIFRLRRCKQREIRHVRCSPSLLVFQYRCDWSIALRDSRVLPNSLFWWYDLIVSIESSTFSDCSGSKSDQPQYHEKIGLTLLQV